MLRNYLKISWRNLNRNKIFSFINIIGLSIGISASLIIYLIVSYDMSFDQSHRDRDRIFRVVTNSVSGGQVTYIGGITYPLSDAMHRELTGLDMVVPLFTWFPEKLSIPMAGKERPIVFKDQQHIVFADENYFSLVEYKWLAGSPKVALLHPYDVVLTESNADLYFPGVNPVDIVGRTLYFRDTIQMKIRGVVKDLSYHTDFLFKTFISRSTLESTDLAPVNLTEWGPTIALSQLFIKLSPSMKPGLMENKIANLAKNYVVNEAQGAQFQTTYKLQPLSDLHFNHLYGNIFGYDRVAHKPTLYSLLGVSAFLILLACINFINLSTAQSSQRAKEIGIRKTIGSSRTQLIFQFLSETFVITLLATILSIILTPFLLKAFEDFIPNDLHFELANLPGLITMGILLLVTVSLLSGFYPALILSSYRPVDVLKDAAQMGTGQSRLVWLRKTLTISQFVIAQVFVFATLIVSKQITYSLHKDLGFKKEAIINFYTSLYDTTRQSKLVLLDRLNKIPGVFMTSLSNEAPFSANSWTSLMTYRDDKKEVATEVDIKYGDANYCRLYQIRLLAGEHLPYSDTIKYLLINDTYARILGFQDPNSAIGRNIEWNGHRRQILGVVADFHQKSLHNQIKPSVITSQIENESFINVSLVAQNPGANSWKSIIGEIQKAWTSVYPDEDFRYKFQDEEVANSYKMELQTGRMLGWATGLSIFISCMGLMGLVIYTIHQRTKEIGIRKIVGASVTQIIFLLSSDLIRLVGLAFLVAVPIAWCGAYLWLENFAYRTTLSLWIFLGGGLFMGVVCFIILLILTFKAALKSPVESLRKNK
jgi:putative ABC transport system permease protein